MKKLFGTDGIRAVAGEFPLDWPTIRVLGRSLAALLHEERLEPIVIVGRDTRESGAWLEEALVQGFRDGGGEAVSAGVIPTSAISFRPETGSITRPFLMRMSFIVGPD